jgi:hypothetical protein
LRDNGVAGFSNKIANEKIKSESEGLA